MLDVSLLRDPAFMLIGVSNVFGMAGLYVPFVYIVDAAQQSVSCLTLFRIVDTFKCLSIEKIQLWVWIENPLRWSNDLVHCYTLNKIKRTFYIHLRYLTTSVPNG